MYYAEKWSPNKCANRTTKYGGWAENRPKKPTHTYEHNRHIKYMAKLAHEISCNFKCVSKSFTSSVIFSAATQHSLRLLAFCFFTIPPFNFLHSFSLHRGYDIVTCDIAILSYYVICLFGSSWHFMISIHLRTWICNGLPFPLWIMHSPCHRTEISPTE